MAGCCFRLCRNILVLLLVLCLGLFITAGVVDNWWSGKFGKIEGNTGLWRSCVRIGSLKVCQRRENLMKFEDESTWDNTFRPMDFDILILALAVAALGTFVHLILVARTMCQSFPRKGGIISGSVFFFFSVAAGVFATIWALVKISSDNQDWAFYCLYGANGLSLLAFGFSLVVLCTSATRDSFNDDEIAMLKR